MVGLVYFNSTNHHSNYESIKLKELHTEPEPLPITLETKDNSNSTRAEPGTLKWSIQLGHEELSTPAICDLYPPLSGDFDYEVVVGSAADMVVAVDKNGNELWRFNDCVIDNAHVLAQGLDFDPAPFFSSITPVDIAGGKAPELMIGEEDGILCLTPEGKKLWSDKGTTDGYYFSSVAVTDLEGDFKGIDHEGNDIGIRDDLEIILGSDNQQNADAFLECWQANGNKVFRHQVPASEHAFMTCSIVVTELDGFFFGDEKRLEWAHENDPETLFADLLCGTHDSPGRVWKHIKNGAWNKYHEVGKCSGHETYCTATVANFTGDPELECIVGYGSGKPTWEDSSGMVIMFHQDGSTVGEEFSTGEKPSSVFSSPASCDAQNLKEKDLNEGEVIEYEVYFGCDNGIFYCLNAKDLSLNWQYQTGGRILSSPAICNIDYDEDLEVIIGSDDGKVYCFEGDPHEMDRDGNPDPKDDGIADAGGAGGSYDILWTFDIKEVPGSSCKIGISSPVVGDLDCDGQLEVIIGDTGGTLYCINAGGKCVPGQLDWPKFRGDLNNTGFYNPPFSTYYGVLVDRGLQNFKGQLGPEKLQKTAKPGQIISYNITVQNTGILENLTDVDTYWLSLEQIVYKFDNPIGDHEWLTPVLTGENLKWDYEPEGDGTLRPFLILQRKEVTNLTLYVTAPWTSELSEFCRVKVIAQSANSSFAHDSIITETTLEMDLDFKMEILKESIKDEDSDYYGLKIIKINPSDKAMIELKVKNKGNINDSYDLAISTILSGWEVYFVDSNSPIYQNAMQLDAPLMEKQFPDDFSGSEGVTSFVIEAPVDAQLDEILTVKVMATSKYSLGTTYVENTSKVDFLIIEVNPRPDLELKCQKPRKYVQAGQDIIFEVEVLNHGNSDITVKLEHSQLGMSWGINFMNDQHEPYVSGDVLVDVVKDGEASVLVILSSPMNATAGSRQNVVIKGTTQGDAAIVSSDSLALTAIISQTFDIDAIVTPEVIETDPGSLITYEINIINNGNGHDFVIVNLFDLKINWDSTFYLDSDECYLGDLLFNKSLVFTLQIVIPENELAGEYNASINVTSLGESEFVNFKTIVKKVYNLSVYGVVHSKETGKKTLNKTLQPYPGVSLGSKINYLFEIKNNGNHPDWIIVSIYPMSQKSNRGTEDLVISDWTEFEKLNWTGYLFGLANTEAYFTNIKELDFSQNIDVSNKLSPFSYLNNNNSVRNMQIRLGVGQIVWLKVQLTVPHEILESKSALYPNKDDTWYFRLEAYSTEPEGKEKEEILIDNIVLIVNNIRLPDLEIVNKKIYHPNDMQSGKIVTISAVIRNIGDIAAQNVVVTFYVNGKVERTSTINKIAIGQSRLIPFNWEVVTGEQELVIRIDPDNVIEEKNENNNEAGKTVNVETSRFLGILSEESCVTIAWLFVLLILIAIPILLRRRFKRSREEKKDQ